MNRNILCVIIISIFIIHTAFTDDTSTTETYGVWEGELDISPLRNETGTDNLQEPAVKTFHEYDIEAFKSDDTKIYSYIKYGGESDLQARNNKLYDETVIKEFNDTIQELESRLKLIEVRYVTEGQVYRIVCILIGALGTIYLILRATHSKLNKTELSD